MFTKIIDSIRDLFMSADARDRRDFARVQTYITGAFANAEELRRKQHDAEQQEARARTAAQDFRSANSKLVGNGWFVQDHEKPGWFQYVKWFAVLCEAAMSMAVADFIFRETLGKELSSLTFLVRFGVSAVFAFVLLKAAMFLRNLGRSWMQRDKDVVLARGMFILPLIIIPVGAAVIALGTEDGGGFQLFMALFTAALNLLVAYISDDFQDARKAQAARGRLTDLDKSATAAQAELKNVRDQIGALRQLIARLGTELRVLYARLSAAGEVPQLVLSLPARYALNRWVYYEDVLPLPENPRLTIAPRELDHLSRFWSEEQVPRRTVPQPDVEIADEPAGIQPGVADDPVGDGSTARGDELGTMSNENPSGLDNDTIPPGDKIL